MMLASSPGMVSSVMSGKRSATPARNSRSIASRTSAGRLRRLGEPASSRAYSGKSSRQAVM